MPKDYLRLILTGEYATEVSDASGMQLLDVANRCWSDELLGLLQIDKNLLGKVYESCEVTGKLTKEMADLLGLCEGTVVVGGAGDNAAAAVGTGVVKDGKAFTTIGTSGVVFAHTSAMAMDPKGRVHTCCAAVPGSWHVMGVTQGAGLSLKWFRDNFCAAEKQTASLMGVDEYYLMDKEAETPLLTAQGEPARTTCSFVPEEAAGVVDVNFSFDASNTDTEREIVIFEELYRNGRLLATHADYENTAQTVRVTPPSIKTYASDMSDGDKEITGDCMTTIIDSVSYAGLIPNEEYEIDGTLMIDDGALEGRPALDAFGRPITAHVAFTPDASHGNVTIPFEIDATLLGDDTKLVVFEKLFANDALMAEHADLHDEDQTVRVKPSRPETPPEEASPPNELPLTPFGPSLKTGDSTIWMLAACGLIGAAAFGLLAALRRKAFGPNSKRE